MVRGWCSGLFFAGERNGAGLMDLRLIFSCPDEGGDSSLKFFSYKEGVEGGDRATPLNLCMNIKSCIRLAHGKFQLTNQDSAGV